MFLQEFELARQNASHWLEVTGYPGNTMQL